MTSRGPIMKTATGANTVTHPEGQGQYSELQPVGVETVPASSSWTNAEPASLMEAVVATDNMQQACRRVVANKGAPGTDGMPVDQLADHLKQYWPTLRERLLAGEYHPSPVRAVEIPKPKGGARQLGIPTVSDRLIQQAASAMKAHVTAGHRWVVDLDLKAFFDRVNHDLLMASLSDFLENSLRLTVNHDKSAVDRPWNRGYLGYTLTRYRLPKLTIAKASMQRLMQRVRDILKRGRGRNIRRITQELAPVLQGWASYFSLVDVKRPLEALDTSPTALRDLAAMETSENSAPQASGAGSG
ncbi:hypothetical protein GCM10027172_10340 [Halomonas garicola]